MDTFSQGQGLVFIVAAPRSGSTLLQRMLGSHSALYTHPEPHLLTPLAYLGYYDAVDGAPYDAVNAGQAVRELVDELPRREADYLDALRAYANTVYGRILAPSGKAWFVDKTPAYALVLPFIARLFPQARYVVLTRHPFGILHSRAHSFFNGDYAAAQAANPVLERYVPAIGDFLLDPPPVAMTRIRYDDLVLQPEVHMRRLLDFIGVPYEPGVVDYGQHAHIVKSYGDPVGVGQHERPVTDSLLSWARDLQARPEALPLAQAVASRLEAHHLEAWGYPESSLWDPLGSMAPKRTRRDRMQAYQVKRSILLMARDRLRRLPGLRQAIRTVRHACDLLLRDG